MPWPGRRSTCRAYRGRPLTAELLRESTDLIMGAVRDQLAEVRGETAAGGRSIRRPPAARGVLMRGPAVLGAGSWGTTFAKVLADAGGDVTLLGRRPELAAAIAERHENPDYLPGVRLPPALRATADPAEALAGARDRRARACRPSRCGRTWPAGRRLLAPDATLVSLMKGIELGTAKRMSEVIGEVDRLRRRSGSRWCPGPTWPGRSPRSSRPRRWSPASDAGRAELLQAACYTPYFRPYTNTDVVGCELGGAVKNVIALAAGIAEGMGFGDNTRASLITRGLAETARLGVALGADPMTFAGLAGLGDLVATCSSPLSRNRTFGEQLGRGESLEEAQASDPDRPPRA